MKIICIDEVIILHRKIIAKTGGSEGIRDLGLIESAINKAFATFDGQDLYQGSEAKIAAITFALINNHGFVDGNKRIGIAIMLLLLRLNGIGVHYTQQELISLGFGVAEGSIKEQDIRNWILNHKSRAKD
jgi:death-on-curing protein